MLPKTKRMLDEITPVLKPLRRSKVLTAEPTITEMLPLVASRISFQPFVNYLKEKRPEVSDTREKLYTYLIKRFEGEPELLHIENVEVIQQHADLGTADHLTIPSGSQRSPSHFRSCCTLPV